MSLPRVVAIVGSRNYPNLDQVRAFVQSLPPETLIVSGDARGVDEVATDTARDRGLPTPWVFQAHWMKHRKAAGHIRNDQLISFVVEHSGGLVAFWDGISTGTKSVAEKAKRAGVLYAVYGPDGSEL